MHYFLSFGDRLKMFAKKIPLQLCQTIAIGSFLLLGGKWLGHVDITWLELLVVFSTVIILDFYLIWQLKDTKAFPFSAVNTGIGISLFLRTDLLFIYFVAGFIAIFSKYIVAIKDKHFLNPSYSAIFICLVLFQTDAYVTHVQWGNDWQVLLPILIMGAFVAWRAKVWDAVLMFFVSWFVLLNLFMEYTWHDLGVIYLTGA